MAKSKRAMQLARARKNGTAAESASRVARAANNREAQKKANARHREKKRLAKAVAAAQKKNKDPHVRMLAERITRTMDSTATDKQRAIGKAQTKLLDAVRKSIAGRVLNSAPVGADERQTVLYKHIALYYSTEMYSPDAFSAYPEALPTEMSAEASERVVDEMHRTVHNAGIVYCGWCGQLDVIDCDTVPQKIKVDDPRLKRAKRREG